jgi:hypothetical protein
MLGYMRETTMARLPANRIAWTYTDDGGFDWRVAAEKAVTDQAKLGGSAAAATVPEKPAWLKMRRTTVRNATNSISRTVPVYAADAAILTAGETINLNLQLLNGTSDSAAFTQGANSPTNIIGEKRLPRGRVTSQSA